MKKLHLFLLSLLVVIIGFSSCSNKDGFKKGPDGIRYKQLVHSKDSAKLEVGDILTLSLNYWVNINGKDSLLMDSAHLNIVSKLELLEPTYPGDIYQAIGTMSVGDSTIFKINAADFITKTMQSPTLPDFIDSTTSLYIGVKVFSSATLEELEAADAKLKERLKGTEMERIEQYLAANNMNNTVNDSGYYMHFVEPGIGNIVNDGDYIGVVLNIKTVDGKQIFNTDEREDPYTLKVGTPVDTRGFNMAIKNLKNGSIAKILVPSELAFGEDGYRNPLTGDYIIEPYTPIAYDVEVINVKTKLQFEKELKEKEIKRQKELEKIRAEEVAMIKTYVKENYPKAKMLQNGLYYAKISDGKGSKPKSGQNVKVHYTGTLLNGTVFDSSVERGEPFQFTLGVGHVIQGWDIGVANMSVGEKAVLIIPSELGYGERQVSPQIPANSTLIFDVELIEVLDK
ncbi:MAG: FKBP-type peptidyl-prolyl cis-trans isomerase [Bacteroidales bacterium]|jgi:FKBP-type peptidyl-prolyl cis-trans isomerase